MNSGIKPNQNPSENPNQTASEKKLLIESGAKYLFDKPSNKITSRMNKISK